MRFLGYRRSNGTVGVRNHVLIFPTQADCGTVAVAISRDLPGTVAVTHHHGYGHFPEEKQHMIRAMTGYCSSPNVAGVLLIDFDEVDDIDAGSMAETLRQIGQRVETISVRRLGGTTNAVARGKALAEKLLGEAASARREPVDVSELIVGTKCGGSDTLSGLTANPALGVACDLLVAQGGSAILSETAEMLGTEHLLSRRAATDEVSKAIWEITSAKEASIKSAGVDVRGTQPSPMNIAGGLTTLEEKSLGSVHKGGSSAIREVVAYAVRPSQKGLVIMDGPCHDDFSHTGMTACGAQIIVFTTGTGLIVGSSIAPVMKVSTNTTTYREMSDNIDINAGTIVDGEDSIQSVGERIFREIIDVASGKLTRAEILGHNEFGIHTIFPII
jgi:altronate dehydratase large subunit